MTGMERNHEIKTFVETTDVRWVAEDARDWGEILSACPHLFVDQGWYVAYVIRDVYRVRDELNAIPNPDRYVRRILSQVERDIEGIEGWLQNYPYNLMTSESVRNHIEGEVYHREFL